ncbi:MAG TPA: AarF/UbiB family protein [Opitutaceae bacterium]
MKPFDLLSHAVRAKEIFTVLARHGFADLLEQIDLPAGVWSRFIPQPATSRTTWERIRLALEELGPTFIKFGQLLSMRPDVLPDPLILELRKLQNAVQPLPFDDMRPVLLEDLPADPADVFTEFDEIPVASASLAQVYFARLRADGRPVAVKVQRPHIARKIQTDLELVAWFAGQLHQRVEALRPYDLPTVVEELRNGVKRELDFVHEARNQQYFQTLNPEPEHVFAPAVFTEWSSARVLVMQRIDGTPVGSASIPPEMAKAIAAHGAQSIVHQILIAGFFHADPHAGNVLVTPDGRLCFLDWGLAGHLTRRLRYALADFWLAAVQQDAERTVQIATTLAPSSARIDLREMERDVTLALREELNFAIGRQEIGRAMLRLIFILGSHGIPLSRDFSLMAKAVLAIEEVGRVLDPKFDMREHAAPVLRKLHRERAGPRALLRSVRAVFRSTAGGIQELPGQLQRLIRRLEQNDFTINLQHHGLEDLDDALETAANRISLGVVIGSLIIGSSLIVTTNIPPYLFGYPALGIVGYLLSAVLGLYIIWDIIRHGRHR